MIWSKWRSSVAPHFEHLPPSLFHTSSLTHVGITLRCFGFFGTGLSKSSSPSTAANLNLNTSLPLLLSFHESTRWKIPLYDQMPCLIFSYTLTRSGSRRPLLYSWAALWNLPFSVRFLAGVYSGWSMDLGSEISFDFGTSCPSYIIIVPSSSYLSSASSWLSCYNICWRLIP